MSNAQKAAFANKLAESLDKNRVTKTALLDYIKHKYEVESRNEITEQQWTQLAAQTQSCRKQSNTD